MRTQATRIAFYAFRYALGRKTYAVSDVAEYLKEHWDEFDVYTQQLIHKEINEAIEEGMAGMDCDVAEWRTILTLPIKQDGEDTTKP